MYRDLMYATPGPEGRGPRALLQGLDLRREARRTSSATISPRADVTIVRDKGFGVPHIYGTTRAGDDVRRRLRRRRRTACSSSTSCATSGRAQLSSFIGGAPANRAMDAEQWSLAPYTEADFQRQFDLGDDLYGDRGRAARRTTR